jgi:SagB-type dehydrogenase family enzyme
MKGYITDQQNGFPYPDIEKEYENDSKRIILPSPDAVTIINNDIYECINNRKSRREFTDKSITIEDLSYLLWATQGIKNYSPDGKKVLRTVPSGGCRHPFVTYLAVNNVTGLEMGIYRYLPVKHKLVFLFKIRDLRKRLTDAACNQKFAGECAVCFIWSAVPYRTEWRYGTAAYKDILIEAGHLCQNLYLAVESIGCGTCAIAAYTQKDMDEIINVDGNEEMTIYLAPVGTLN